MVSFFNSEKLFDFKIGFPRLAWQPTLEVYRDPLNLNCVEHIIDGTDAPKTLLSVV